MEKPPPKGRLATFGGKRTWKWLQRGGGSALCAGTSPTLTEGRENGVVQILDEVGIVAAGRPGQGLAVLAQLSGIELPFQRSCVSSEPHERTHGIFDGAYGSELDNLVRIPKECTGTAGLVGLCIFRIELNEDFAQTGSSQNVTGVVFDIRRQVGGITILHCFANVGQSLFRRGAIAIDIITGRHGEMLPDRGNLIVVDILPQCSDGIAGAEERDLVAQTVYSLTFVEQQGDFAGVAQCVGIHVRSETVVIIGTCLYQRQLAVVGGRDRRRIVIVGIRHRIRIVRITGIGIVGINLGFGRKSGHTEAAEGQDHQEQGEGAFDQSSLHD